jgi:ABC-type branched-subunit amino acid transport system permease subunit
MQRGTSGRVLPALDQSEPAALSIGINPARARVEAFAISAAVAGLGGGLLATHEGQASPGNFTGLLGLFWVAVVVTLGARRVTGAVAAGFALVMLPELLSRLDVSTAYQFVLFGLGTLAFARHPEGLVDAFRGWRVARRERVALVVEEAGAAA